VPPTDARRQRELMNQRGVVKQIIPAEKTPEEIAAENRQIEEQKRQAEYDRYLLQAYQSVGELERTRDERMAALDGRMTQAQKALTDNTAALEDLRKRDAAGPAAGDDLDPTLKRKIREFAQARDENISAIERIKRERVGLTEQFDRDIRRYQLLRETAKAPLPR